MPVAPHRATSISRGTRRVGMGRSPWGSVRKLPSGRFQARYCVDRVWHGAPMTFRTKREADGYLASVRSDVGRGSWIDPDAGKVKFGEYSSRWLAERPQLRPRTRELYEGELRLHIIPALGETELGQITPSRIRTWRAAMISAGKPGASTVAKCYRLIHAVFATAVEDGVVMRNPCNIKGASTERPAAAGSTHPRVERGTSHRADRPLTNSRRQVQLPGVERDQGAIDHRGGEAGINHETGHVRAAF